MDNSSRNDLSKTDKLQAERVLNYISRKGIPLSVKTIDGIKNITDWAPEDGEEGRDATKYEWDEAAWQDFLKKPWSYKFRIISEAQYEASDLNNWQLETVKFRNLTKKYLEQPVQLEECNVSTIAPPKPIPLRYSFVCTECSHIMNPKNGKMPKKCNSCDSEDIMEEPQPEDMVDAQWFRIQDLQRDTNISKIPLSFPVRVTGEDKLWKVGFNHRIKPKGILHLKPVKGRDGQREYNQWFEMLGFDNYTDGEDEVTLTDEDIAFIRSEQQKSWFWRKVIASNTPWIVNMDVMKEAVLLGIGSMRLPKPLRILLIGDPSTGKSDVLEFNDMLLQRHHFVVMRDARGTGLTATSVKDPDTDQWTIEPGEFARSHEWCLFIDEFQAGREDDIAGLNYVIWSHKIRYSLAGGVNGDLDAKCALIIACNPHTGTMGKDEPIHEILKFIGEKTLPAFISRMSFILYIKDDKTAEDEDKVGRSIYRHAGPTPLEKYQDDYFEPSEVIELEENTITREVLGLPPIKIKIIPQSATRYGIKTLRKIVKYVTEKVQITDMPENLEDYFVNFYVKKRMDVTERVNKLISPRFMNHCLGMAQVLARWHGRPQPNEEDMKHIFNLMLHYMSLAATDKNGEIDANILNGNLPESRMQELDLESAKSKGAGHQIDWACKKAGALHEDGYFTLAELQEFLHMLGNKNKWSVETKLMEWIDRSVTSGSLKTGNGGMYKWTPTEAV